MIKYILFLALISLSLPGRLAAQDAPDTAAVAVDTASAKIRPDTLSGKKKGNWFKRDYPNPKKAALLSLIIPGAGQIYNKRWWKTPLVYGALTGMALVIDYNQSRYRRLRTALNLKRQDEPHEFSGTTLDNLNTLRTLRDNYDKNTQTAYVGMVLVYVLQAMEAFVDCHLKGFNVDDDLSLKVRPSLEVIGATGQPVMGVGFAIPLNGRPLQKKGGNLAGR
ncbi:MAG: hypothetical protein J5I98_08860 [Phaeodactylibacter sp.]|nr:hypothetical protein [Phaeodactylibacter sp.]